MEMTHLGGVQVLDLQDGRVDSPGLDSCRTWETVEEDWGWGPTCFWILLADYRGESTTLGGAH